MIKASEADHVLRMWHTRWLPGVCQVYRHQFYYNSINLECKILKCAD